MGERVVRCGGGEDVRGHAQLRSYRATRWTGGKRVAFLEHLATSANVTAAAQAAGISKVQVYRIRRRDPGFRAAWREALCEGYEALEIVLLDRALHGVEKPVFYGGKQVGVTREFNDAVALRLLTIHRAEVAAERARHEEPAEARAVLTIEEVKAKLADMRERQAALEADEGQ